MARGADDRKNAAAYLERAQKALVWDATSTVWSNGVPWAEALKLAQKALSKACPKPKAVPKGKPAPKARGKAKAKARLGTVINNDRQSLLFGQPVRLLYHERFLLLCQ